MDLVTTYCDVEEVSAGDSIYLQWQGRFRWLKVLKVSINNTYSPSIYVDLVLDVSNSPSVLSGNNFELSIHAPYLMSVRKAEKIVHADTEPPCTCASRDLAIYGCQCQYSKWKRRTR